MAAATSPPSGGGGSFLRRLIFLVATISSLRQHDSDVAVVVVNAQPSPCDDGSTGYNSLEDLNRQIVADATAVSEGLQAPQSMYLYRLCPGSSFQFSEQNQLQPLLDGSVFQCGDGLSTGDCRFRGGTDQVLVEQSPVAGVTIRDLRFQGVTFTDFSNSAVTGSADSGTKVTFEDTVFTDFNSRFAIQQTSNTGRPPYEVNIFDSTFRNAEGGSIFSNDGGSLVVQDTNFFDSDVMSIGAVNSGGVIMLVDVDINGGNIEHGFMAVGGSTLQVENVEVSGLTNVQSDVFSASGRGSAVRVSNAVFMDNDMRSTDSTWNGIRSLLGSRMTVRNVTFVDNYQLRSAIALESSAVGRVNRVVIESATGTLNVDNNVSSLVFVNQDSFADVSQVDLIDVSEFTTGIFLNERSQMTFAQSCLTSGNTQGAVYVSEDSIYTGFQNYIDQTNYFSLNNPTACPQPGDRLIQESPNSNCFEGTPCDTTCLKLSEPQSDMCLAQVELNITLAPTMSPDLTLLPNASSVAPTQFINAAGNATVGPTIDGNVTIEPDGTIVPSMPPTIVPSMPPNFSAAPPSNEPSLSQMPSTSHPSARPSTMPSVSPSMQPSVSAAPSTPQLSASPSLLPSNPPSTSEPSVSPSDMPSSQPSVGQRPSVAPSRLPSASPTPAPTRKPTQQSSGAMSPFCDCRKYWYHGAYNPYNPMAIQAAVGGSSKSKSKSKSGKGKGKGEEVLYSSSSSDGSGDTSNANYGSPYVTHAGNGDAVRGKGKGGYRRRDLGITSILDKKLSPSTSSYDVEQQQQQRHGPYPAPPEQNHVQQPPTQRHGPYYQAPAHQLPAQHPQLPAQQPQLVPAQQYPGFNYNYDPCVHYCQWIIHQALAFGATAGADEGEHH